MARTIEYWYDYMIAEKNSMSTLNTLQPNIDSSQTLLSDLTTTSKVARWRLWIWVVAACIYALDVLFDLLKTDLETIAKDSRYGTLPWYVEQSKKFQYGYTLVWSNNQYQYSVDDPAARIITQAAAIENVNGVVIKVAKLSGSTLVPLTASELAAFQGYWGTPQKVKPAGVPVTAKSNNPDDLQLTMTVNYDPLLLSASGELLSSPGTFPVVDAVNNFIANLEFNSVLELCFLEDAIQSAQGVESVYITDAKARYGINPFTSFSERYTADAGYLQIDPLTPLSSTITYVPSV